MGRRLRSPSRNANTAQLGRQHRPGETVLVQIEYQSGAPVGWRVLAARPAGHRARYNPAPVVQTVDMRRWRRLGSTVTIQSPTVSAFRLGARPALNGRSIRPRSLFICRPASARRGQNHHHAIKTEARRQHADHHARRGRCRRSRLRTDVEAGGGKRRRSLFREHVGNADYLLALSRRRRSTAGRNRCRARSSS